MKKYKVGGRTSENFALSVRYVMAIQHIVCCGLEAQAIMEALNLPNSASMKSGVFHQIENEVGVVMQKKSTRGNGESIR